MTTDACFVELISAMDVMAGPAVHLFYSMNAVGVGLCNWLMAIITRWLPQLFFMGEGGSVVMTPFTGYATMNEVLESVMTSQTFV
jgi:hypothetical protein